MKTTNKLLALLLALTLLISVPVVAAAAEESTNTVFAEEILNSITTEETTGNGLAFLIRTNVRGAAVNAKREFINDNAVVTLDGVDYSVVAMGAVMVRSTDVANVDSAVREDATEEKIVLDIPARYMWSVEEDGCSFAVRIINLPQQAQGVAIAARPYVVLKDAEGNEFTHYGDSDIATYNACYYENMPEEKPVLSAETPKLDKRLEIADATAEYVAYAPTTYREAFEVSLTLNNVSANAKTSEGDTIACTFKDAEGNVLGTGTLTVDVVSAGESKEDVKIYVPVGTATIEATQLNLNYVPDIIMPAIGSDIDVTKKKNRIRVSAAEASFNEDGTIHVKWTFTNYTSNWITEETNYIKYRYYKDSTPKGTKTLYIGVIDTKKNKNKTFEFDVPDYTTEVRITSSSIVYWTEWA